MKKATILVGPQASGKTTTAEKMVKGRKSVTIVNPDLLSPFCYNSVDQDTEVIIFEEFRKQIVPLNSILNSKYLTVNKYNSRPETIERPELIIITQKLEEHLLQVNESVEIIHCVRQDPYLS